MGHGFSLSELVIVVAIIGIMAAIAAPRFENVAVEAKEAAVADDLRALRSIIQRYAALHDSIPPGYKNDNPERQPRTVDFLEQLTIEHHFMREMPGNPFNHRKTVLTIDDGEAFPSAATGDYGWVYQPSIVTIRVDWPGTDEDGVPYFEY